MSTPCLLCCAQNTILLLNKTGKNLPGRHYFRCQVCDLIFVPPSQHLSLREQEKFYQHHQNNSNDPGYRKHLAQLTNPLKHFLEPGMLGLDYGCGPGPTLATLICDTQTTLCHYDPIFFAEYRLLKRNYDFITCTEVAEHFTEPKVDWQTLCNLLKPNGILGVMTQFQPSTKDFADWWYHRDATHICFYSRQTFHWLAQRLCCQILLCENPIVIFKKSS